ncbi:O-antigen ligase family protein [bacterium]|nr:O-antigen ligase family protein [bacterium]MBU1991046.1 O-antigen ligase family protein [bacterium]
MTLRDTLENKYYSSAMLLFIFCYAFFNIKYHHLGDLFLGFILIGSIPLLVLHKNKIFKDPVIIVLMLTLTAQILSWINSLIFAPEFAAEVPKLDRLGKLFVFFFIAYWLKGRLKNIAFLWLFFIFGFLFAIVMNVDLHLLFEFAQEQQRADFSIKNAQFDSMLAGSSLLMSLSLFYITLQSSRFSKEIKILLLFGISLLIVLFTYLVLITQSRQVWLGLISIAIVGPVSFAVIYKSKNLKFLALSYLAVIGVLFLFSTSTIVQKRFLEEQNVVHSIFENNETIEMSSIGIRVNSWLDAAEWIQRHPILGLDSEAIAEVIHQSEKFDAALKKQFGHLHNFFIETLVAYGFVGLLLILALYYFILRGTQTSSLSEDEKKYHLLAGICFVTYWLIINNFETFNSRMLGVFAHNIIFASFYTFHISAYLKENAQK